jgi:hypothetical protein
MSADAVMPLGVVIERRATRHQWMDDQWRPVGVLPPATGECGKLLAQGEGWTHFHGGTLNLELFRGETEGYRTNLSQDVPMVYVVLRRNDEREGLEFEPFMITACPYEAMAYTEDNDDFVEGVPMPPDVIEWLREFVTLHHVDTPFVKRKNRRKDERVGRPPPIGGPRGLS